MCDANVMSYNQEKLVFEQHNPETPDINPEIPDHVSGVSGQLGQNTKKITLHHNQVKITLSAHP
jgi:hypothetical protein